MKADAQHNLRTFFLPHAPVLYVYDKIGLTSTHYMIRFFNWESSFRANIEKYGWRKGMLAAHNALNINTDGSKMEDGVGKRNPFKLPDHCTIFQTEAFDFGKAAGKQASK